MTKLAFPTDEELGDVFPFMFRMEGGGKHIIDQEIEKIIARKGRCKILEIGLFVGSSAQHWLENHEAVELVGVDVFARNDRVFDHYLESNVGWATQQLDRIDKHAFIESYKKHGQELTFFKNMAPYRNRISVYRGNYLELGKTILADHPDIDVYIDADKKRHMLDYSHELFPLALLCGDDWNWVRPSAFRCSRPSRNSASITASAISALRRPGSSRLRPKRIASNNRGQTSG